MQDPRFWRRLRAEFETSHHPRGDCHAILAGGEWTLSGPESLKVAFQALAVHGAVALGIPRDRALAAWLDRVRQTGASFFSEMPGVYERECMVRRSQIVPSGEHQPAADPPRIAIIEWRGENYVVLEGVVGPADENDEVRCVVRAVVRGGILKQPFLASACLCRVLETEAFAERQNKKAKVPTADVMRRTEGPRTQESGVAEPGGQESPAEEEVWAEVDQPQSARCGRRLSREVQRVLETVVTGKAIIFREKPDQPDYLKRLKHRFEERLPVYNYEAHTQIRVVNGARELVAWAKPM